MAKGQKRGNRETRKPKSEKQAAPVVATSLLSRAALAPVIIRPPKKK